MSAFYLEKVNYPLMQSLSEASIVEGAPGEQGPLSMTGGRCVPAVSGYGTCSALCSAHDLVMALVVQDDTRVPSPGRWCKSLWLFAGGGPVAQHRRPRGFRGVCVTFSLVALLPALGLWGVHAMRLFADLSEGVSRAPPTVGSDSCSRWALLGILPDAVLSPFYLEGR